VRGTHFLLRAEGRASQGMEIMCKSSKRATIEISQQNMDQQGQTDIILRSPIIK